MKKEEQEYNILEEYSCRDLRIYEDKIILKDYYAFYIIEDEYYFAPVEFFCTKYELDRVYYDVYDDYDNSLNSPMHKAFDSKDKNKIIKLLGDNNEFFMESLIPFIYCFSNATRDYRIMEAKEVITFLGCLKIINFTGFDYNKWKPLVDEDHWDLTLKEWIDDYEKKKNSQSLQTVE